MPVVAMTFPNFFLNSGRERQGFINGAMDVAQRGAVVPAPSGPCFCADRWRYWNNGTASSVILRQVKTPEGSLPRSAGIDHALEIDRSGVSGETSRSSIGQRILGVDYGAGGVVSLGFWVWADSPTVLSAITSTQTFGTGGSPSPSLYVDRERDIPVSTIPTWHTLSFSVDSIAGKTLGTNNDDFLQIVIYFLLGDTAKIYLTGMQVNTGPTTLPFQRRSYADEFNACRQYYEKVVYSYSSLPSVFYSGSNNELYGTITFSPKVIVPRSVVLGGANTLYTRGNGDNLDMNSPSISVSDMTQTTARLRLSATGFTAPPHHAYAVGFDSRNGYVEIDAEL